MKYPYILQLLTTCLLWLITDRFCQYFQELCRWPLRKCTHAPISIYGYISYTHCYPMNNRKKLSIYLICQRFVSHAALWSSWVSFNLSHLRHIAWGQLSAYTTYVSQLGYTVKYYRCFAKIFALWCITGYSFLHNSKTDLIYKSLVWMWTNKNKMSLRLWQL